MKFEIGEIAIFMIDFTVPGICQSGSECEIYSGPYHGIDEYEHGCDGEWYWCVFDGDPSPRGPNNSWAVRAVSLRKKKPPEELSTWEEVQKITGWNPTKQNVEV